MQAIYLDCFSGISGNMILGGLLDIGLPEAALREALEELRVSGYNLKITRVSKCGISAIYVDVELHKKHHHRHLPDIFAIIDNSGLAAAVKEKSKAVFLKLAQAEAKVHGTTVDKIHFHEVGAVDAIVDVVGAVFGFHYLGIEKIYVSKINVGSGYVRCSHGLMSVPAPATVELLKGIPYYSGDIKKELATPTGAAIASALASGFGDMPEEFSTDVIGYGAGTWELEVPNVLRMHMGTLTSRIKGGNIIIEANIDDLNPQNYDYIMEKLFAAGALDVWLTPVIMKKGRPGVVLSVLLPAADDYLRDASAILLTETTTLGMRHYSVQRITAERKFVQVDLPWGKVNVKFGMYQGKVCNCAPEYEDCRKLALEHGVPLKIVQQAAMKEAAKLY